MRDFDGTLISLLRPLQAGINLSEVGLIRVTGQGLAVAVAGSKWEYCVICQDCFSPLSSLRYVRQFQTTHVFFSFFAKVFEFLRSSGLLGKPSSNARIRERASFQLGWYMQQEKHFANSFTLYPISYPRTTIPHTS